MKAIKVIDKKPVLVDVPEPKGEGVKVKVVSSSICGSDIHMMALDAFGDHIIGHEFAGLRRMGGLSQSNRLQVAASALPAMRGIGCIVRRDFSLWGFWVMVAWQNMSAFPLPLLLSCPLGWIFASPVW